MFLFSQGRKGTTDAVDKLMRNIFNKSRIGELMCFLLRKQYPSGAKAVTFDELLQWELWPNFIKIYGMCI